MKTYKFRARDLDSGEYVYAELGQVSAELNPEYLTFITDDVYTIDATTLVQLVGYDKDGREIYEGDTVTVDGEELDGTAKISPEITFGNGFGRFVNETTQKSITLKE